MNKCLNSAKKVKADRLDYQDWKMNRIKDKREFLWNSKLMMN